MTGLVGDKLSHVGDRLLFEISKSHDDVGDLHAGVVDVVLNFDLAAACLENANERVADRCISQMTDVRGLVGIDVGVLDNNFAAVLRDRCRASAA